MIRGTFITSNHHLQDILTQGQQAGPRSYDSKYLIVQLLQTDDAIELFCKQNSISYTSKISMIIEAYNFLQTKIDSPPPTSSIITPTKMRSYTPIFSNASSSSSNVDIKAEVEQVIEEIEFDEDDDDDFFMDNKPSINKPNNTISGSGNISWSEVFDDSTTPSTSHAVGGKNLIPKNPNENLDVSEILAAEPASINESSELQSEIVTYDVSEDVKTDSKTFLCSKCHRTLEEPPVSFKPFFSRYNRVSS